MTIITSLKKFAVSLTWIRHLGEPLPTRRWSLLPLQFLTRSTHSSDIQNLRLLLCDTDLVCHCFEDHRNHTIKQNHFTEHHIDYWRDLLWTEGSGRGSNARDCRKKYKEGTNKANPSASNATSNIVCSPPSKNFTSFCICKVHGTKKIIRSICDTVTATLQSGTGFHSLPLRSCTTGNVHTKTRQQKTFARTSWDERSKCHLVANQVCLSYWNNHTADRYS